MVGSWNRLWLQTAAAAPGRGAGELLQELWDLVWGPSQLGLHRCHLCHQLLSLHVVPHVGRQYGKSGNKGESNFPLGSEHLKLRCCYIVITAKACLCSSALHPGSVTRWEEKPETWIHKGLFIPELVPVPSVCAYLHFCRVWHFPKEGLVPWGSK